MKRDLSKAQFEHQAEKLGWRKEFMGYWLLVGHGVSVYPGNAGKRYRDRISYLRKVKNRLMPATPTADASTPTPSIPSGGEAG